MSTKQRNAIEEIFNRYSDKAQAYRKEIARSNRTQPTKLFTERVAELALSRLGE